MGKWILVVGVGVGACGSSGGGMPDARTIDAAPVPIDAMPVDAFAAQCSSLTVPTASATKTQVAQAAPVPGGGTLDPGTYVLTDWSVYTGVGGASGPAGFTARAVLTVDGTNFHYLNESVQTAAPIVTDLAGTYSLANAQDTSTETCPMSATNTWGYDATPTTFVLYLSATEVETYTKQ